MIKKLASIIYLIEHPQQILKIETKMKKTILNLQRIEQTIMMWRTINYLTRTEDESSSQTIDIPEDSSIKWNDIKYHKGLIFKTISDPEQIEKYYAKRNTHHLN